LAVGTIIFSTKLPKPSSFIFIYNHATFFVCLDVWSWVVYTPTALLGNDGNYQVIKRWSLWWKSV